MKRFHVSMIVGSLLLATSSVFALEMAQRPQASLAAASTRQLVVGVVVDAQGKVTYTTHAGKLPAKAEKLLRESLDSWITGPAVRNGQSVASKMLVTIAINSAKESDGNYRTSFSFVSSQSFPASHAYLPSNSAILASSWLNPPHDVHP